nr:MAG TPA: apocytochrome F [Crassvirales sp.]
MRRAVYLKHIPCWYNLFSRQFLNLLGLLSIAYPTSVG